MLIPALAAQFVSHLARWPSPRRQLIAVLAALLVTACGKDSSLGDPGFVEGFAGAAVADEPYAALVGRDLLAAGGTAGDAAAGMFFALAVVKPAAAGLLSSGICLGYDPAEDFHQAYRFQSPEGVRAFAAIHARFGQLPWGQSVGHAEAMARFGVRISKAFAQDWYENPAPSDEVKALFGEEPVVSDQMQNLPLASLLGQIRQNGAGAFYRGPAAKQMWDAMEHAGIAVDKARWRGALPEAQESLRAKFGYHDLAFSPFPDSTGPVQASVWPQLEDQGVKALPRLLAEVGIRAPASAGGETSIVAVDRFGGAVACSITMGQPFGTGKLISGVFLPVPAMPSTSPTILTNTPTKVMFAALAAAGAPGLPSAIMLETMDDDVPFAEAMQKPRSLPGPNGGFLVESGASPPPGPQSAVTSLGRVNGVVCTKGLPHYAQTCTAISDPRGRGFAAVADSPG